MPKSSSGSEDDDLPATDQSDLIYTDEVISTLIRKYNLQMNQNEFAVEIRHIGRNYIIARNFERYNKDTDKDKDQAGSIAYERQAYVDIAKSIEQLKGKIAVLDNLGDDIAGKIAFKARLLKEPRPTTDFPSLSKYQIGRGNTYFHELIRLLGIVDKTAEDQIKQLKPSRKNSLSNLQHIIPNLHFLWTEMLGQEFTIGYRNDSGPTKAFDFIKDIVSLLDENITDSNITTTMRWQRDMIAR